MYDTNEEYQIKTQELQNKLSRYERETNQHQEILTATVQKNKSHIDKLQEEKAMLEVKGMWLFNVLCLTNFRFIPGLDHISQG